MKTSNMTGIVNLSLKPLVLTLAVLVCLSICSVIQAADQDMRIDPGVRDQWVRLLINSSRGDNEADAALLLEYALSELHQCVPSSMQD